MYRIQYDRSEYLTGIFRLWHTTRSERNKVGLNDQYGNADLSGFDLVSTWCCRLISSHFSIGTRLHYVDKLVTVRLNNCATVNDREWFWTCPVNLKLNAIHSNVYQLKVKTPITYWIRSAFIGSDYGSFTNYLNYRRRSGAKIVTMLFVVA